MSPYKGIGIIFTVKKKFAPSKIFFCSVKFDGTVTSKQVAVCGKKKWVEKKIKKIIIYSFFFFSSVLLPTPFSSLPVFLPPIKIWKFFFPHFLFGIKKWNKLSPLKIPLFFKSERGFPTVDGKLVKFVYNPCKSHGLYGP